MKHQQLPCPDCGATARVKYRTVTLGGVVHPVDPRLVCVHGHSTPLPSELAHLRDDDAVRLAEDEGLIG